ncbi:hypothetical protein [Nocardiopsis coralliicola]
MSDLPPTPEAEGAAGKPQRRGNRKLLLVVGSSVAAVALITGALLLVLKPAPFYAALVECDSADLVGSSPSPYSGSGTEQVADMDSSAECAQLDSDGAVIVSAWLHDPEADTAVLEELVDERVGPADAGLEHDTSLGEITRAAAEDEAGVVDLGVVTGNLFLTCSAQGEGESAELLSRAESACSSYLDSMEADAPRA